MLAVHRTSRARQGSGLLQLCVAEVLVDGLPADPVVTGKKCFSNTGVGALNEFGRPVRCDGLLPSFVGSALLGQGDAFAPALPDEQRSNSAKAPMTDSNVAHGGVVAGGHRLQD